MARRHKLPPVLADCKRCMRPQRAHYRRRSRGKVIVRRPCVDCLNRVSVSLSPTKVSWKGMRQRCNDRNYHAYPHYGAKGVRVCARWNHSTRGFAAFLADMGERPEGTSIDRENPRGNYEPGNCRWATAAQQAANKRDTAYLTAFGRRRRIQDWAKDLGITPAAIRHRLKRGWPVEKAVTVPRGGV